MTTSTKRMIGILLEIKLLANDLPEGKARKVKNRCDKISAELKKAERRRKNVTTM